MQVFATLTPVFLIILLGALLRRTGFLTPDLVAGLNRLTFWVALPALMFYELVHSGAPAAVFGKPFLIMIAGMVVTIVLAYLLAPACRVAPAATGTFVQASYRGNLAFIALPVVVFAGQSADPKVAALAVTTVIYILASVVPCYNIAAVVILLARPPAGAGRSRLGLAWSMAKNIFVPLVTNPLILSCLAAAAWMAWAPPLPAWAARTLESLDKMALPLALLGIGATLHVEKIRGHFRAILGAGTLKVVVAPLVGWALARALGLGPAERRAVLICLASPTATVSFVMADQLGGDGPLAAGAVAASTIASFVPLSLILALF